MELFKVFVILIAFTCQILAKPPINNLKSSKTLDSEEISAFEEIKIEVSQENEEPVPEFPDPKIMDDKAMKKEIAHDEDMKVNYSQSNNDGGFQLEFVSISRIINHMTCYKF